MTTLQTVERLVGIYDADGGFRGEVAYVIGHLIGRRNCALCDITHSWKGRKRSFDDLADSLGVPFDLLHRDELPDELADIAHEWPSVLAVTDAGPRLLLDKAALDECDGEPEALLAAIRYALTDEDLPLPT